MSNYRSILPRDAGALSLDTLAECIDTLRYLQREFREYGRVDAVNMRHVDKALALVEAESAAKPAYHYEMAGDDSDQFFHHPADD